MPAVYQAPQQPTVVIGTRVRFAINNEQFSGTVVAINFHHTRTFIVVTVNLDGVQGQRTVPLMTLRPF